MNELFPIVCGILTGVCCGGIRTTHRRTAAWIALCVICGATATLVSGEYRLGWEYLCIDVPLVAGAAWGAMTLLRFLRLTSAAGE